MNTETPPDWVLLEAAKRGNLAIRNIEVLRASYSEGYTFTGLCDMIQKYEKPPVCRKLLCAREALVGKIVLGPAAKDFENVCIRAIELWEEGFGK
jgi:hypothetical protein